MLVELELLNITESTFSSSAGEGVIAELSLVLSVHELILLDSSEYFLRD